ncbi:MAG: ParB/RepB/Spo0J family partition protein [Candidatus Paceibacterota bacterium]
MPQSAIERPQLIDPRLIRPRSEGQPRTYFLKVRIEELAKSIAHEGQLEAVQVFELTSEEQQADSRRCRYELVFGEYRWRACLKAGIELLCNVVTRPDRKATYRKALAENLHRNDLTLYERVHAVTRLYALYSEGGPVTEQELADEICISQVVVNRYLRIGRLPDEVVELFNPRLPEKERLQSKVALELEKYPEAEMKAVAPLLVGLTLERARQVIKEKGCKAKIPTQRKGRIPSDLACEMMAVAKQTHNAIARKMCIPDTELDEKLLQVSADRLAEIVAALEKVVTITRRLQERLGERHKAVTPRPSKVTSIGAHLRVARPREEQ